MSEKDADADADQGEGTISPKESTLLLNGNVVPHIDVVGGVEVKVDAAVQPAFVNGGRRDPRSPRKVTLRASVASMAGAAWFPQALRLKAHRSTRASVTCFLLHGFLVLLHVIFLALYIHHVEQQLILPLGTTSNIATTAITIVMQSFITVRPSCPSTHLGTS